MPGGAGGHDIALRDGRSVRLRAMTPADEAELLQAFDRMGRDTRYMRFMHAVQTPNVDRLRRTLASFPEHGIGIVATVAADDGIDIVGSAIAVFDTAGTGCEFATTVGEGFRGAGLAGTLMRSLIAETARRGRHEMVGYVLAENRPMLGLAQKLGFVVAREPDDATVRVCRLVLAAGHRAPHAAG